MRTLKRILLGTLVAIPLVYAFDYLVVRYRSAPTGVVMIRREFSVKQKNKRTEFYFDAPQPQTCSHSLLPQLGYPPCWYLERHRTEVVEM